MLYRAVPKIARPGAALVIGLALALGQARPGFAHAHVVTATPGPEAVLATSPASLTLGFDSALADTGNQIVLYRADRSTVGTFMPPPKAGNPPTLRADLPPLSPGIYTVAWTSVSGEDGHTLSQFYAFTVGEVPAATAAPTLPPLKVGDTQVTLSVARGDVGPTVFHASVRDAGGKPLTNLQRVIFRSQPVGLNVGQDEIVAPASGSDAQTPAFTLGLTGAWQFEVIVRRSGLDDVSATVQVSLIPAPGATPVEATVTPTAAGPAASPTAAATAAATPTTAPLPTAVAPTGATTLAVAQQPASTPTAPAVVAPTAMATPSDAQKLPDGASSSILIVALAAIVVGVAVLGYVWWRNTR